MKPFARCYHRRREVFATPRAGGAFTAPQVAKHYNFPAGDGAGQTIGIIELGGGFTSADLSAYFAGLGLPVPPVTPVSVDGAVNAPGADADAEVLLDIEVAGAVAPRASIRVYFAPNTEAGFIHAIQKAGAECDILSISWGAPEDAWSTAGRAAMQAACKAAADAGVSIFAAAGDNGSSDGEAGVHVDLPACLTYVTGCGGTTLTASSENVWNDGSRGGATGGGVSTVYMLPDYQARAGVPGGRFRGVPDVAGNADPDTGYLCRINGQQQVIGGTSAVAPLWAGLTAILNQKLGKRVGFLNPVLYGLPAGTLRDIVSGSNGAYAARAGWDACTGLGSPDGAKLLAALLPTVPPVPPPPVPPTPRTTLVLSGPLTPGSTGTYTVAN